MTIHTMKSITFKETNFKQWENEAIKTLRGKPFERLITKTIEGIDLHPLYTQDDLLIDSGLM